jgi:hypothetical protein
VLAAEIAFGLGKDSTLAGSVVAAPPVTAIPHNPGVDQSEGWEVLRRDQLPPDALVRLDHAGEWVAWDRDLTRAVATGADMEAVRAAAVDAGVDRTVMEWVPPTPVRPIGHV